MSPSSIGGPLQIEADNWALFRFDRLRYHLCRVGTLTSYQLAVFQGAVQDTAITTLAQAGVVLNRSFLTGVETVPTPWCLVQPKITAGQFVWYKSVPGTMDASEEAPGLISVTGTGTDNYLLEVEGVVCFKMQLSQSNTPMALYAREVLRLENVNAHRKGLNLPPLDALPGRAPPQHPSLPPGFVPVSSGLTPLNNKQPLSGL